VAIELLLLEGGATANDVALGVWYKEGVNASVTDAFRMTRERMETRGNRAMVLLFILRTVESTRLALWMITGYG
jgi:hypothetical protein